MCFFAFCLGQVRDDSRKTCVLRTLLKQNRDYGKLSLRTLMYKVHFHWEVAVIHCVLAPRVKVKLLQSVNAAICRDRGVAIDAYLNRVSIVYNVGDMLVMRDL